MDPVVLQQPRLAPRQRPWMLIGMMIMLEVLTIISIRHAATSIQPLPSQIPLGLAAWQYFLFVGTGLLAIILAIRLIRIPAFIDALFAVALFLGVWVYCWSLLPWDFALLIASGLTILQARIRRVFVHDLFMLVGAAGIAIHFAFLFNDRSFAMIFACFLIYDMVAGRPRGAVARLASALVHRGVIPGLIVPAKIRSLFTPVTIVIQDADAVFLGAGDLILPMALVARAAVFGWKEAIIVSLGALCGYAFLAFRKSLKPFPAFVPTGLGSAIPYFLLVLIR